MQGDENRTLVTPETLISTPGFIAKRGNVAKIIIGWFRISAEWEVRGSMIVFAIVIILL